jgi:hypothetical protein
MLRIIMLKTITVILAFIAIVQPVAASDSLIYIRPGTLENQTEGFVLMYPLENTVEQEQTVTFRNEDLHRRPFTLVSEENLFPPTILTFRNSLPVQFDEPGTYNFYLEEKPTVTVQLTVVDYDSDNEPQATQSPPHEQEVVEVKNSWAAMKDIPGFCIPATLFMLILAILIVRKKRID